MLIVIAVMNMTAFYSMRATEDFLFSRPISRLPYRPIISPLIMNTIAMIFPEGILSLKIITEPSMPKIGTNRDNGATTETGYLVSNEFHTQ